MTEKRKFDDWLEWNPLTQKYEKRTGTLKPGAQRGAQWDGRRFSTKVDRIPDPVVESEPKPKPPHRQSLGTAKKKRIRRSLYERDGYNCYLCSQPFPEDMLQVEHKTPRSRGGTNKLENLGFACEACNMAKGDMTPAEYRIYLRMNSKERKRFHRRRGQEGLTHALSDYWPRQENGDPERHTEGSDIPDG